MLLGNGKKIMGERPILFNGEMVRAVLSGKKTQTRRVIKNPEHFGCPTGDCTHDFQEECNDAMMQLCPYGKIGDELWVREKWRVGAWQKDQKIAVDYAANNFARKEWLNVNSEELFERLTHQSFLDAKKANLKPERFYKRHEYKWEHGQGPTRWRPSIHLPRWASRIQLKITNIRVERVQDISTKDISAEGVVSEIGNPKMGKRWDSLQRMAWVRLWDSINKDEKSWSSNPYVWVVEFERIMK